MKPQNEGGLAVFIAVSTSLLGALLIPYAFPDRVPLGRYLGHESLAGLAKAEVSGAIEHYNHDLRARSLNVRARGASVDRSLADLGVNIDTAKTIEEAKRVSVASLPHRTAVTPSLTIDRVVLYRQIHADFGHVLTLPRNASLTFGPGATLRTTDSLPGESINVPAFEQALTRTIINETWTTPLELAVIPAAAEIQANDLEAARQFVQQLLQSGFLLAGPNQDWPVPAAALKKLIVFTEQTDPQAPRQLVLGVTLNQEALAQYLAATIAPGINTEPQDARFELENGQIHQTYAGLPGQTLNVGTSLNNIEQALAQKTNRASLAIDEVQPSIRGDMSLDASAFTTLLARGESNFTGSPANRIHNIKVGTTRYHGLLVPPGAEFSFNHFLGPVSAAAGYKPELVIKHDKTIPEYGGGLCQVSTTIFRAAAHAGLPITERRNHAYVVSYYGRPGFDATIYPGVTDLKFVNNTPGHLLLQTAIEGAMLAVEVWGQFDGREVQLEGPLTYDRKPDGAVRAVLKRTITKEGQVVGEDTFYSRYRSPKLFPKPTPTPSSTPTPTPPRPTPTATPKSSQKSP